MHLSKRLKSVAELVTPGRTVADIGCDHAYTALYLILHDIAPKVIAMDINEGPLLRARENILKYRCENRIETRKSDGVTALLPGEAGTLVIAGMGGRLMAGILEAGRAVVEEACELILQPQSELQQMRRYLHQIGFSIADEAMVWEDGKYYSVLKAHRGQERYGEDIFYLFGQVLLLRRDPCLKRYLYERKEKTESVLKQMEKNASPSSLHRMEQIKSEYFHIIKAIGYYEERQEAERKH